MIVSQFVRAAPRPLVVVSLLLAILLLSPAVTQAATMLTNGHPVHVRLPVVSQPLTLFNGDSGFSIVVPPGATTLTVEFATAPGTDMELVVAEDTDVGTINLANRLADFRARPDGNGVATVTVFSTKGQPRLKPTIYFIGFFFVRETGTFHEGTLRAIVDGSVVEPERTVQESDFTTGLDGWTHNDTPSPLPGSNVGARASFIQHRASGGNPGGYARVRDGGLGGPEEWFVAPDKFLLNLIDLPDARFEFDILRTSGDSVANFNVEIRVFGADGVYRWTGERPPTPNGGWQTFSASIRPDEWHLSVGDVPFAQVISNPQRIEVRATFTFGVGSVGLDNFRLLSRAEVPALPVLPMVSGFAGGIDGWRRNFPADGRLPDATFGDADSLLLWNDPEGNPGGFLRIVEAGGSAPDAFVVAEGFEGNMSGLNAPRFEFDYRHHSESGATAPVRILLIGRNASFMWTGAVPGDVWAHQTAHLTEPLWTRVSGEVTFAATLSEVERIEISADQAAGPELNSLDNFALLTVDTPPLPQTISANPPGLDFPAVLDGPNPGRQVVHVTSGNGSLRWETVVTGAVADRVSVAPNTAETPSIVMVEVDTQGLALGTYQAQVSFVPVGVNISPSVVFVSVTVGPQPPGTPQITSGGVVHAATFQAALSPGSLATVFGSNFANAGESVEATFVGRTNDRLPTQLQGVRVLIQDPSGNVVAEAPLLYLDENQINFQMPFEVFGLATVQVVVDRNGTRSSPRSVEIDSTSPGVFTFAAGRALAVNQNGSLNQPGSGAGDGEVLTVYLSGGGSVAPTWPSGRAASAFPLIRTPGDTSVSIGGEAASVEFIGLAPGMVGVVQMNVRPSSSTPSGDQPLVVSINGAVSNAALVTIN